MENTNSLGLLLSFARPCRRLLAASVGLAVLGVASGMVPYFAVSYMIVALYAGTATPGSLFLFALIALLGQAGRVALGTASTVLSHRAAFAILKGIRTDIAAKLSRMPLGSVIETPSGKLKTLIVDTVEKMEVPLAHLIPELTSNLLVPLFMAAYLFWLDWRMALLALATFPVGLFCYMAMTKDYAERYATVQDAGKGMNAAIVEYINGIEVIKAFNQSSASYGKFVAAVRANRDAMKDWFRATNGYYVAGMAIAPASLITVLPRRGILPYERNAGCPRRDHLLYPVARAHPADFAGARLHGQPRHDGQHPQGGFRLAGQAGNGAPFQLRTVARAWD